MHGWTWPLFYALLSRFNETHTCLLPRTAMPCHAIDCTPSLSQTVESNGVWKQSTWTTTTTTKCMPECAKFNLHKYAKDVWVYDKNRKLKWFWQLPKAERARRARTENQNQIECKCECECECTIYLFCWIKRAESVWYVLMVRQIRLCMQFIIIVWIRDVD